MVNFPKSRAEARGTPTEWAWDTPSHWPREVRHVSLDDQGLGINPKTNQLYWDGYALVTEKRWSTTERILAGIGLAIATVGVIAAIAQAYIAWLALLPPP